MTVEEIRARLETLAEIELSCHEEYDDPADHFAYDTRAENDAAREELIK